MSENEEITVDHDNEEVLDSGLNMSELIEEAKETIGIDENLNEIDESEEETVEDVPVVNETIEDDDAIEDTDLGDDGEDFNDEDDDLPIDEEAVRSEFAEEYGFSKEAIAGHTPEQLEVWGKELDRRALENVEKRLPTPPMPFQAQTPAQPIPTEPASPAMEMYEKLRAKAEEEGMDEEFMRSLEEVRDANLAAERRSQDLYLQQQQAQQAAIAAEEEAFDEAVNGLGMPKLFGKDRQDAFSREATFNARRDLYQKTKNFALLEGVPLTPALVKRVANVIFDGQIQKSKKQEVASKARRQSKKRLGTGKLGTGKAKRRAKETDTGDERMDNLLDDPDFAEFADKHGIEMH